MKSWNIILFHSSNKCYIWWWEDDCFYFLSEIKIPDDWLLVKMEEGKRQWRRFEESGEKLVISKSRRVN